MKGFLRKIPEGKLFGFIRASTGLDNIFIHKDNFHGDWESLRDCVNNPALNAPKLTFEMEDGLKGPRAVKCVWISEDEYKSE